MRHSASRCLLALGAMLFAQQGAAQSQLFFHTNYDLYSLKAKDALEADKDGSGYTLGVSGSFTLGQGYVLAGIGYRQAKAKGENYDRSQEVEVSDALLRLGYLHALPGFETSLRLGLVSDISRGKGADLSYEGAATAQTVMRLAPLIQWYIPVGHDWVPYLEGSYAMSLNGKAQRETRSSFGLGVMLAFGGASKEPPPPPPPKAPEPAVEQELTIGGGAMLFPLGEVDLHASLKSYLHELAQTLKEQLNAWSKLSIVGFSESTETQLYGKEVGPKRAQAVKEFFIAEGISEDRLVLAEPGPATGEAVSRQRVDIQLSGGSLDELQRIETRISSQHKASTLTLRPEILTMDKSKVDVSAEGKLFLQKLGRILKTHSDKWKTISVMGYTDVSGTAETNRRIAVERAGHQAAILIEEGLAADRVKSLGVSTAALLDKANPTSHWNRRVEIEINGIVDFAGLKAQIDEVLGNTRSYP